MEYGLTESISIEYYLILLTIISNLELFHFEMSWKQNYSLDWNKQDQWGIGFRKFPNVTQKPVPLMQIKIGSLTIMLGLNTD